MIAIKKHSAKPKIWSFEMPNALYSNRYLQKEMMSLVKGIL